VAINCGAIAPNLIESELFGHERGAFTTAINQHKGKFEIAFGGTLFLDEIGELDKELQVKLLRVLEEKEFLRVGGNITLKTDVRIIAATSRNLKKAVESGHFRDDLFYRLNVVPINIPPLKERPEDIALLLDHFIDKYAKEEKVKPPWITAEAREALCGYAYPGNIRELKNIVERMFITCPSGRVTIQDLPDELGLDLKNTPTDGNLLKKLPQGGVRLQDVERELIFRTLELTSGNKTAAANILGITRRRLYLRLAKYADLHRKNIVTSSYTPKQNWNLL
jgi:two-component system NtrC family response regulator